MFLFTICNFHSTQPRQSRNENKFLLLDDLEDQSFFHKSRNSESEFVGWNQQLCRSVLTPISCTKFKVHSTHSDSPTAQPNWVCPCLIWIQYRCRIRTDVHNSALQVQQGTASKLKGVSFPFGISVLVGQWYFV